MKRTFTIAIICHACPDTLFSLEKVVSTGGFDRSLGSSLSIAWSRGSRDLSNRSRNCFAKWKDSHTPLQIFNTFSPPTIYNRTETPLRSGRQYLQIVFCGYFVLKVPTQQTSNGVESGHACGRCIGTDICDQTLQKIQMRALNL